MGKNRYRGIGAQTCPTPSSPSITHSLAGLPGKAEPIRSSVAVHINSTQEPNEWLSWLLDGTDECIITKNGDLSSVAPRLVLVAVARVQDRSGKSNIPYSR